MANAIRKEADYKPVKGLLNENGEIRLPYDFKIDIVPDFLI